MFWILCFLPLFVFAEREWIPHNGSNCEWGEKEIFLETPTPIHVKCSYPIFFGKGALVEHVNRELKTDAKDHFNYSVQEEIFTEELWEDGCTLSYELSPVYQTSNLISIYGCDFQGRGCHGCSYYEGKTFWKREDSVIKLVLDDLFIKGSEYRPFILQYCESHFKTSGYGYYSSRSELPPDLDPSDLDIFILTDRGLMIIFRAYTIGGWADGPDTVLIPYAELKKFIDPLGPLKKMLK